MEFDGLKTAGLVRTEKEFRTVKNDSMNLKTDLIQQKIMTGKYILPDDTTSESFTKELIDNFIVFLNS